MDACAHAAVILLLLALAGCASGDHAAPSQKPAPPYAACLAKPADLPPIATPGQVRERHDALDKLYDDCAVRTLRNAQSHRFYIR